MQTEEQRLRALQDAGLNPTAQSGVVLGTYTGGDINSNILNPTPGLNYGTPNPTPVSSIDKLDSTPPVVATPQEEKATDLTKRLQELNERLVGKSVYRSEQETAQNIPELMKTQTDLSARLKTIQNEALAIPIQLQQEATGRGITTGGLRPLETARLRENAIQALGVSSLLESSRGNLTLAQDLVDKAVAQKYGPIEEEISAKTKNLELIIKSPEYTLADKNRAQAQLDIQEKKKTEVALSKANQEEIWKVATTASANGADFVSDGKPEHATLAQTLNAISKAKTKEEALQIATDTGLTGKAKTTQIVEVGGRKVLIDSSTGKTIKDLGASDIKPKIILTPENRRDLSGAGFGSNEISDIERSVNDFGIKATLSAIDDENKRRAVAKQYNASAVLDEVEIEKEAETKLATTKRWWQFWK